MAETDPSTKLGTGQQRRIHRAVDEAIKRRDRYAEDRVGELLKALDGAADDVAKQIRRFEKKAALKQWQQMRLAILRDLEKEIEGIARELNANWKVGIRDNVKGSMRLGIEDGISQLEAMQMPDFEDLTDVSRNALVKRTFATIDRAAVDFLANYQVELLGDVSAELASGIKRTVSQGVLTGKPIPEVARDIGRVVKDKDAFRRAGKTVFKTAQRRATLIACPERACESKGPHRNSPRPQRRPQGLLPPGRDHQGPLAHRRRRTHLQDLPGVGWEGVWD